jgi:organic hydroperoxide reductase OsmC/OhrA
MESQNLEVPCAIPPEFEGPGGALSPEDLFAQALTNCFLATFKVYAEKSSIQFSQVSATSELIVDLDENKKPIMKKFILNVEISGCENAVRTRAIAERAFASGFILNSVKTELHFNLNILNT